MRISIEVATIAQARTIFDALDKLADGPVTGQGSPTVTAKVTPAIVPMAPTQEQVPPEAITQEASMAVPTAAPVYTADEVALAATKLLDAGGITMEDLQQLLGSFGVESLPELTEEQRNQFVMQIREKGAEI